MSPRAIIVTIGSEILLGDLLDTNAAWLSREMVALGIEPVGHQSVGDGHEPLAAALRHALEGADVVVTTGGLGPTADDATRQAASMATGRSLEFRAELVEPIRRRLAERGRPFAEANERQAFLPAGAEALPNPVGTAPGFAVETDDGPLLICLPGVSFEMEQMWRSSVEPLLRGRFPRRGALAVRVLKCVGAGESTVDELLGELTSGTATATVAFQLVVGEVHLRLVGHGVTDDAAREAIVPLEAKVRSRLGRLLYGHDDDTLASVVVRDLRERGERLSTVEGATGGALALALATADPDGAVFIGGRVATEAVLWGALGGGRIPEPPESEARALALAREAAGGTEAAVGLASTGLVRMGHPEPAATYHLAVVRGVEERVRALATSGPLPVIHRRAALGALDLIRRLLHGWSTAGP
ncbi:MAG: CinA family nicotinamide mononucleotide deamidase-related protein [bacterium]